MGKKSRDKGARIEREMVHALQDEGFAAERVPLSGAMRGRFGGDISVPLLGRDRRVEVKARADGFRELYKWLEGSEFLIVKADRHQPLVVVPLKFAMRVAMMAEKARAAAETKAAEPAVIEGEFIEVKRDKEAA
jgi:Holliday junction resolvase